MASVQWIRINTDMFDNAKIKYIRTLPSGNDLVVIWVMLLTKAGKCNSNGFIFLTENIPYTSDMLASEFGFEVNTINLALNTFANLNMIQLEDSKILITGWEEHQNIEGLEKIREQTRKRVARHREKLALQMESMTCQYCGSKATGYDHIIATARGGEDVESNKVPCCIECNRIKNDKPLVDFLNSNRDRINDNIVLANEKLIKHVTLCNVTDRYTVTHGNGTEEDKEVEEDIEKDKDKEVEENIKIEVDIIKEKWNSLGLNKLTSIKNKRLSHVKARIKEVGKEEFYKAIESINHSSFLKGENDRGWTINFDWFINPNNFTKVIEGNYIDKKVKGNKNNSKFFNFESHAYDYDDLEKKLLGWDEE